jgi:hypothetical protein
MAAPVIAPDLAKALKGAGPNQQPLNVFVKIARYAGTPVERSEQAAKIVKRVEARTHVTPKFQYRDLDGVLQVKANVEFLRELVRQPEILEAREVPGFTSALIEPVKQRDVDESEIDTPYAARRRKTPRGR